MSAKPAAKKKAARPQPPKKPPDHTAEFERLIKKSHPTGRYVLRLYITGTTPRSTSAVTNIRALCEEHLAGRYELEVVDLYQDPAAAAGEEIIAAPTLIKKLPAPARRLVGDLDDRARVMLALELTSSAADTQWLEL